MYRLRINFFKYILFYFTHTIYLALPRDFKLDEDNTDYVVEIPLIQKSGNLFTDNWKLKKRKMDWNQNESK